MLLWEIHANNGFCNYSISFVADLFINFFLEASQRSGILNPWIWLANSARSSGPDFPIRASRRDRSEFSNIAAISNISYKEMFQREKFKHVIFRPRSVRIRENCAHTVRLFFPIRTSRSATWNLNQWNPFWFDYTRSYFNFQQQLIFKSPKKTIFRLPTHATHIAFNISGPGCL